MPLTGQAKTKYQREYMRERRGSNATGPAQTVRPKKRSSRFMILQRDNFRCQYCGKTPKDDIRLEIDHIIPLCKGGSDEDSNLITACFECNRTKGGNRLNFDAEQSIMPNLTEQPPAEIVRPEPHGCKGCKLVERVASHLGCPKGQAPTLSMVVFEQAVNPERDCEE